MSEKSEDKTSKMVRVQFDMPKSKVDKVDALIDICGLESRKDVINVALSALDWMAKNIAEGNNIAAVNKKTKKYIELALPIVVTEYPTEPKKTEDKPNA